MTTIPNNDVTEQDVAEWFRLQEELKRVKAAEMLLRLKIFKAYFPSPTEGTNTFPMAAGWVMKGKYVINRDIDPGALGAYKERFRENGINPDVLVRYKPELVLSEYRELTAEQQKFFDNALVVKPGTPSLEIVLPAKAKKEQQA